LWNWASEYIALIVANLVLLTLRLNLVFDWKSGFWKSLLSIVYWRLWISFDSFDEKEGARSISSFEYLKFGRENSGKIDLGETALLLRIGLAVGSYSK
jgi:uncharacterized membrane protein